MFKTREFWFAWGGINLVYVVVIAIIAWVGKNNPDGYWGQTTAAWLQALFSVFAICAVVWVDGLGYERQADQRKRDQRDAERNRMVAIANCISLLENFAAGMEDLEIFEEDARVEYDRLAAPKLAAAIRIVSFYLQHSVVEVPVTLVSALATAERTTTDALRFVETNMVTIRTRDSWVARIREDVSEIQRELSLYEKFSGRRLQWKAE